MLRMAYFWVPHYLFQPVRLKTPVIVTLYDRPCRYTWFRKCVISINQRVVQVAKIENSVQKKPLMQSLTI